MIQSSEWFSDSLIATHTNRKVSVLFKYLIDKITFFFRTGFWPLQVILRIIVMGNVIILWALVWMPQTTPWSSYWCVIWTFDISVCDFLNCIARRRLQNELIVEPSPLAGSPFKTRWSAQSLLRSNQTQSHLCALLWWQQQRYSQETSKYGGQELWLSITSCTFKF